MKVAAEKRCLKLSGFGLGRTVRSCRIWEPWWRWQLRWEVMSETGWWGPWPSGFGLLVELWGCAAWELWGRWPLGWKVMWFNGQWWKVSGWPRFYVSGSFSCILTATKGLSSSCNKLPQGTVNRALSFPLMVTRMMIKNCVCVCVHAHAWVLCMKYVIVNLQGTVHFMIILDWCFVWTPIDVASIECMTGHFHH